MSSLPLDNLVRVGQLKTEPPAQAEFDGAVRSGRVRLRDADNPALALEGRFDPAYNAARALSLAALRWHGYRPENRYRVAARGPITRERSPPGSFSLNGVS